MGAVYPYAENSVILSLRFFIEKKKITEVLEHLVSKSPRLEPHPNDHYCTFKIRFVLQ